MFHSDELQVIKFKKKRYHSRNDPKEDEENPKKVKEDTGLVQYKIRVQRADEPSNILWKSNDQTTTTKL